MVKRFHMTIDGWSHDILFLENTYLSKHLYPIHIIIHNGACLIIYMYVIIDNITYFVLNKIISNLNNA